MSLEKGISRTGTVLGVVTGLFLSFSSILIGESLGWFTQFQDKYYDNKYMEYCCSDEEDEDGGLMVDIDKYFDKSKKNIFIMNLSENQVEKIYPVYLPTAGVSMLIVFLPFFLGFYGAKGVTGTINWVIKGFRE